MEEEINHAQIGRKFGLIFGLLSTVIGVGIGAARLNLGLAATLVSWAVVISMFVLACREYKQENGGFMAFGKGFSIVMWVSLIGGLLRAAMTYIYTIIDPDYLTYLKELRDSSSFGPPRDSTQELPSWVSFFETGEFVALAGFIGAIFAGLILGAIVAAIMKNESEESY